MSFRFHVIGLPHTQTNKKYCACAYTQKVLNFCKMMTDAGHQVIHYGGEGSEVACQHVNILLKHEQLDFFGEYHPNQILAPSYDWNQSFWKVFNARCALEVAFRLQPRDIVCVIAGLANKPLTDALPPGVMTVEYGIGYTGVCYPYRCYESYAQMHMQWGREGGVDPDGRNYEVVVPNYYDPLDFPEGKGKGDYYLFVGRVIFRKGLEIAVQATKHTGSKLVIAGTGLEKKDGKLIANDGNMYLGDHLEYVGPIDVKQRSELMGNAKALFAPTLYVEPFGGVVVESQLTGTPVICSDWGGFVDNVKHGFSGYRCRTLEQFIWATKNIDKLDRTAIRTNALAKYSLEVVAKMYEEYFSMLQDLWTEKGWGNLSNLDNRKDLNWLVR